MDDCLVHIAAVFAQEIKPLFRFYSSHLAQAVPTYCGRSGSWKRIPYLAWISLRMRRNLSAGPTTFCC